MSINTNKAIVRRWYDEFWHAEKLDVVVVIGADPPPERRQVVGQHLAVRFDIDRQLDS